MLYLDIGISWHLTADKTSVCEYVFYFFSDLKKRDFTFF